MNLKTGLSIWLCFFLMPVLANNTAESLRKELDLTNRPAEQIEILIKLGDYYKGSHYDSAAYFFERVRVLAQTFEEGASTAAEKDRFYHFKTSAIRNLLLVYHNLGDNESVSRYSESLLKMAREKNDTLSLLTAFNYIGVLNLQEGLYPQAHDNLLKAYELASQLNDTLDMARIVQNVGIVNFYIGNLELAARYTHQALELYSGLDHLLGKASCFLMMGNLQSDLEDLEKAFSYYNEAYLGFEELGHFSGKYNTILNIGAILIEGGQYQEAIERFEEALEMARQANDEQGIVRCLHNLGMSYSGLGQPQLALQQYQQALQIARTHNLRHIEANTLSNMAGVNNDLGQYSTAFNQASQSLEISREIQSLSDQIHAYRNLSRAQEGLGNFRQALEYHKVFKHLSDSLTRIEGRREISRMEAQFQNERMRQEVELKSAQIEKQDLELAQQSLSLGRQRLIRNILILGFLVLAGFLAYIYKSLLRRKRTNALILKQNEEISTQHQEITKQKTIIEDKNMALVASIRYAQNIQKALLPDENTLQDALGQMFVIYEPKEIVSGDFYWVGKQNGHTLLALADSTGHGVPGAFMSVMGMSFLNEFVARRKFNSPAQLLDEMRLYVISSLHQQGTEGDSRDGIEMAMIAIDHENHTITYSGARTPLFIGSPESIQLNQTELAVSEGPVFKIKADRMPLSFHRKMKPFTNNSLSLNPGDMVYLMTDGFPDQFGTENRERFTSQRAHKLLTQVYALPVKEQKDHILKVFNAWKQDCEQVDDIALIGFRI